MRNLSRKCGISVNLCAVDEIDTDLDDYNTDRLVNIFDNADHSSSFIIISHNHRLLNTMNFDNIWIIEKQNNISNIIMN